MKRFTFIPLVLASLAMVGCQQPVNVHVVDLNRVLDILVTVLDSPVKAENASTETNLAENGPAAGTPEGAAVATLAAQEENPAITQDFLGRFATELNAASLITAPIGVAMGADGAIQGFVDENRNQSQDPEDQHLFKVEIDTEGSRLIATDESGPYHRDRNYTYRPGGMFMGYMLGSMLSRQNGFYNNGVKPNYGGMQMSPTNYHTQAQAAAKSRAAAARSSSTARSRSGSGGFRFGK